MDILACVGVNDLLLLPFTFSLNGKFVYKGKRDKVNLYVPVCTKSTFHEPDPFDNFFTCDWLKADFTHKSCVVNVIDFFCSSPRINRTAVSLSCAFFCKKTFNLLSRCCTISGYLSVKLFLCSLSFFTLYSSFLSTHLQSPSATQNLFLLKLSGLLGVNLENTKVLSLATSPYNKFFIEFPSKSILDSDCISHKSINVGNTSITDVNSSIFCPPSNFPPIHLM